MARVGIVGTGWGARVQVPAFRAAGLEVAGLAGEHPGKTRRVASELGVPPFADWRALIASPIDLVSLVVPPAEHVEMACAALAAGRHVLAEKPTALDADGAARMAETAAAHPDRLALIDHELRFLPSWRAARERIRDLGDIRHAEVCYSSPSRGDPTRPWNWWSDAAQGGGVWGAVGSHYVDAVRYFIGEIDEVQAELKTFVQRRPAGNGLSEVTSDDFAAVHARITGGAVAAMTFSSVAAADDPTTLTITGAKGAFRLVGSELWEARRAGPWERRTVGEGPPVPGDSPGAFFGSATEYFAAALRRALDAGDRSALSLAATFEDGLAHQRVLDAARRSHENEGRWERVR